MSSHLGTTYKHWLNRSKFYGWVVERKQLYLLIPNDLERMLYIGGNVSK